MKEKERFDLIQALIYLKNGKKVRNIENNQVLWFDEYGLLRDNDNEDDVNRYVLNIHCKGLIMNNEWELYEEEKPILDTEEKAYLEGVLRPFKDRVNYVYKRSRFDEEQEYIIVYLKNEDDCTLPFFEKGTMYKGMELDKPYKLKDLGLFDRKIY